MLKVTFIKRLFLLALATTAIFGLSLGYFLATVMQLPEPGTPPVEIAKQRMTASSYLSAASVIRTVVFALLVFALYKPTNLRSEYVSILVTIYLAAFTGSSVGSLLGAALTYFNLDLAMLVMAASLSHSSIEAIDTTLWGFAAATVSYLRKTGEVY